MRFIRDWFFLFFCLSGLCAQAQPPQNIEELAEKYSEYFSLNREAVFLHMNKTTVVPGENIWFAAYVYNPKFQGPNLSTANLHVNLYDANGQLKIAQTLFTKNGFGNGFFDVDSLPSGKYMVKAFTKYMDNFREDLSFSQPIRILGDSVIATIPIKYDLQLLPEGGHLVSNVHNTVGVKLIDNSGKGVFFTDGKVLNGKNEVVNTFKANRFGLSKFGFVPVPGEKYHVVLTPENGSEISQQLPESSVYGISLTTNVLRPGEILFSFKTNRETFERFPGKTWYMALHKDGTMEAIGFVFSEENLEANLPISRSNLAPGINTVTVFNEEFQPVLERMVFNAGQLKRKRIRANFLRTDRDSLVIGVNSKDSLAPHSISISILPSGTKAYGPKNDIFSAFYIEPYIQGELEDGSYYFSKETEQRRRDYDLDLLLLTQGWSKYSWKNVFNNTPKELFQREVGFTISGKISNWNPKKQNQVFLKSTESGFFSFVKLQHDGSFKLDSMFVLNNEKMGISLLKERNNKVSKTTGYMRVLPSKDKTNMEKLEMDGPVKKSNLKLVIPEGFLKNAVAMDSVVIKAQTEEKELEKSLLVGEKLIKITEDMGNSFFYITDLIAFNGFDVKRRMGTVTIYSRRNRNLKGPKRPTIYLNGFLLYDNHLIADLMTKDVISLVINKTFMGPRLLNGGGGGVIRIETKKYYGGNQKNIETALIAKALNGFATEKEFYAPKYTSYTSGFFEEYGVIDWLPSFSLNEKNSFKILNTLQPEIELYIQGMTMNGALISERIKLKTN